ncbi:MAG: hypothetical protein OWS74_04815 [Firmicutes bacterium]|nr:hypothetical protein [Bacillota bacterium]
MRLAAKALWVQGFLGLTLGTTLFVGHLTQHPFIPLTRFFGSKDGVDALIIFVLAVIIAPRLSRDPSLLWIPVGFVGLHEAAALIFGFTIAPFSIIPVPNIIMAIFLLIYLKALWPFHSTPLRSTSSSGSSSHNSVHKL